MIFSVIIGLVGFLGLALTVLQVVQFYAYIIAIDVLGSNAVSVNQWSDLALRILLGSLAFCGARYVLRGMKARRVPTDAAVFTDAGK